MKQDNQEMQIVLKSRLISHHILKENTSRDHGGTIAPPRVHPGSLLWLYIRSSGVKGVKSEIRNLGPKRDSTEKLAQDRSL